MTSNPTTTSCLDETHRLALRAALLEPQQAAEAWQEFSSKIALDDLPGSVYGLTPLIARNLSTANVHDSDLDRLKGIARRTWSENQFTLRALQSVLSNLNNCKITPTVIKGPALARHYADLAHRGFGDYFLWLSLRDLPATLNALNNLGYSPLDSGLKHHSPEQMILRQGTRLRGPKGQILVLRWHLLPDGWGAAIEDDIIESLHPADCAGVNNLVLSPTAELFLLLAEVGLEANWNSLQWVADANAILGRSPDAVDWSLIRKWCEDSELHSVMAPAFAILHELGIAGASTIPSDLCRSSETQSRRTQSSKLPFVQSLHAYRRLRPSLKRHRISMSLPKFIHANRRLMASSSNATSAPATLTPEQEILTLIARRELNEARQERLKELLAAGVSWKSLLQSAFDHALIPLMAIHLLALDSKFVPKPIKLKLQVHASANQKTTRERIAQLADLIALLKSSGIAALPYKGVTLGALAYGDPALRQSSDLDIIVPQERALDARALFLANGFRRRDGDITNEQAQEFLRDAYHFHFIRDSDGLEVELHWRIMIPRVSIFTRTEELWRNAGQVSAHETLLPVMSPESALISLIIHGAKHNWSRLSQLTDISELIRSHPQMDWTWLTTTLDQSGNLRVAQWTFTILAQLLGEVPPGVPASLLRADERVHQLALNAVRHFFVPKRELREDEEYRLLLPLRDGPLETMRYTARFVCTPTRGDREFLPLPDQLGFVYGVVRPIRLVGQRFIART